MANSSEISDIAGRFFGAIERADWTAVADIYAPTAVIWHNVDGLEKTAEENLASLRLVRGAAHSFSYAVRRRAEFVGGALQQNILTVQATDGMCFVLETCVVLVINQGRIIRLDEYMDAVALGKMLEYLFKSQGTVPSTLKVLGGEIESV